MNQIIGTDGDFLRFGQAQKFLKGKYEEMGWATKKENRYLSVSHDRFGKWVIDSEEIEEFAQLSDQLGSYTSINDFGLIGTEYREHWVRPMHIQKYRPRFLFRNSRTYETPTDVYLEIGRATKIFLHFFRFNELYIRRLRFGRKSDKMLENFSPPYTIRIHNLQCNDIEQMLIESTQLFESCLFHEAYLFNNALELAEPTESERKISRIVRSSFSPNEAHKIRATYDSDLIKYYKAGISSSVPAFRYLALYQVLEFFFLSVYDEKLYRRLRSKISAPGFSGKENELDSIIREVEASHGGRNALEMLKAVLEKFIDEAELIKFIREYQKTVDAPVLTQSSKIFGKKFSGIQLRSGHVIPNTANLLNITRNAIAHSSDKYERLERYVPSPENDDLISKQIPLIRFLVNRIMEGSSKPL